jgi:hypothetical protein
MADDYEAVLFSVTWKCALISLIKDLPRFMNIM